MTVNTYLLIRDALVEEPWKEIMEFGIGRNLTLYLVKDPDVIY